MSRIRIFNKKSPKKVVKNGIELWICQCGLSKDFPFCNGTHNKIQDEPDDRVFVYDADLNRKEVEIKDKNGGCCGGGCC